MKKMACVVLSLLTAVNLTAKATDLPRTFGKLTYGMVTPEIVKVTGAEFGHCASCAPDGDEVSVGSPKHFEWFTGIFPGLTPIAWAAKESVILLTTSGSLSGIILHPNETSSDVLLVLTERLKSPTHVSKEGMREWRDDKTLIQLDGKTIYMYDLKSFPNM